MKRKFIFLLFAVITSVTTKVEAQYETWMLNQYLNQMNANMYKQQQQMIEDLGKAIEQENERRKSQASAVCLLLPGGADVFYAYVTLLYLGENDIELIEKKTSGSRRRITSSSYVYANGKIITPAIFAPGSTVYVRHKESGRELSKMEIPLKSDPKYSAFIRNGMAAANTLAGQGMPSGTSGSGYNNGYSNGSSTPSQKTCSFCKGKGWIVGFKTPTYGSTSSHWCEDCHETVGPSHSHDRCPSCSGLGYTR